MKIVCPLCGKNLPRFESILIHLNRVHPELTKEKALDLAQGAKITDVSRKGDKKVSFSQTRTTDCKCAGKVFCLAFLLDGKSYQ